MPGRRLHEIDLAAIRDEHNRVDAPNTPYQRGQWYAQPARAHEHRGILLAEVDRLRSALGDAIATMVDMQPYVDEYFRTKWGHDDGIRRAREALGE